MDDNDKFSEIKKNRHATVLTQSEVVTILNRCDCQIRGATLQNWNNRKLLNLDATNSGSGVHRLYSFSDIVIIHTMIKLCEFGVYPSDSSSLIKKMRVDIDYHINNFDKNNDDEGYIYKVYRRNGEYNFTAEPLSEHVVQKYLNNLARKFANDIGDKIANNFYHKDRQYAADLAGIGVMKITDIINYSMNISFNHSCFDINEAMLTFFIDNLDNQQGSP